MILGHSERRQIFGETDEALARKVPAALAAGLEPILCVGETRGRSATPDETEAVLRAPARGRPGRGRRTASWPSVVIAYEPIWAIGTGRTATPEQAAEAIAFIRSLIAGRRRGAPALRSGSSTAARSSRTTPPSCSPPTTIDGALVGGASLDPGDFAAIAAACR